MLPGLRASGVSSDGTPPDAWGHVVLGQLMATGLSAQPTTGLAVLPALRTSGVSGGAMVGHALLPALRADGDASTPPEVGATIGHAFLPGLSGAGSVSHTAILAGAVLLPGLAGAGVSGNDTAGHALLPALRTTGLIRSAERAGVSVLLSTGYAWIVGGEGQTITTVSAVDGLALGEDTTSELVHVIVEHLRLSGAFDALLEKLVPVSDGLALADLVRAIVVLHVKDVVALGESVTVSKELAVQLVDALLLASPTTSVQEINALVSSVLALMDAGADLHEALAESGIELGEAVLYQARAYAQAIETLRLSASPSWSVVLVVAAQDGLALGDGAVTFAQIQALVRSGLSLMAQVTLADAPQIAWVMNTESRAVFTYDQWPFNSYAEFGGRHLAAGPAGIYALAGDTDAGVPILAKIRTGLMDMGTSAKKRIESMYLGYSSDGRLGLRVITTMPGGEKQAFDYVMKLRAADATTTNRIKIGRGHASRYYAFELSNVDGSDFTLNGAELLPMVLDRRI